MDNDCRCAKCGNCRHDHKGFYHEWRPKPVNVRGHCQMCGTLWEYDQPVCVNPDCRSHDPEWDCPQGCGHVTLEKHPRHDDYRFPMWRCPNCKEWTDIDWYNRLADDEA